jgi:predicted CXXCH cytochrome family protein
MLKISSRPLTVCIFAAIIALVAGRALVQGDIAAVREIHPAGYVGSKRCVGCHSSEAAAWDASHHANAMGLADGVLLADRFSSAAPAKDFVFTPFLTSNRPTVRIEGADGKTVDLRVAYTFGVYPLQQYLVPFPGGRYQALPFAWDARPRAEGGQRWFNLNPGAVSPGDALHWTGRNQSWNSMCAGCHSTGLRKNYDPASSAYKTTWSDIAVACEACHGAGAGHLTWAEEGRRDAPNKGFEAPLKEAGAAGHWGDFDARGIRQWAGGERRSQIDRCASCHSRRRALQDGTPPGKPLLETHSVALLDDELYYPDGQIKDEVFEYGSFVQSRMWRAQVVCTDCHEPHSAGLKASGNALCAQCHDASLFDAPAHHRHAPGSAAAQCTTCHMPSRTYMGVHVRHDHSFRLPAPARAASLGAPDPCTSCHGDRGVEWAEAALNRWGGGRHRVGSAFADALAAGRKRAAGAQKSLIEASSNKDNPPIARATALSLLARFPGARTLPVLRSGLTDADSLVRLGAVRGTAPYSNADLRSLLSDAVRDPQRAVRSEAARLLAPFFDPGWPPEQRQTVKAALDEWIEAEKASAERPESALNLGALWADLGNFENAETAFKDALKQDARFTSASLNLADLYRSISREKEAEAILREAAALAPEDADAHYALGLALVRRGQRAEALAELQKAAALKPEDARFAYVFGVALNESGDRPRALAVLDEAYRRFPDDRDLLSALVDLTRKAGDASRAADYARALAALEQNAAVTNGPAR